MATPTGKKRMVESRSGSGGRFLALAVSMGCCTAGRPVGRTKLAKKGRSNRAGKKERKRRRSQVQMDVLH